MGRDREQKRVWKPEDEHMMETGTGAGTETRAVAVTGTGTGTETESESETGKEPEMEKERGEVEELWYPSHQETSRVDNQALSFRTRHHLCKEEVVPASNQ